MNSMTLAGFVLILGLVVIHPDWVVPVLITILGTLVITLGITERFIKQKGIKKGRF